MIETADSVVERLEQDNDSSFENDVYPYTVYQNYRSADTANVPMLKLANC